VSGTPAPLAPTQIFWLHLFSNVIVRKFWGDSEGGQAPIKGVGAALATCPKAVERVGGSEKNSAVKKAATSGVAMLKRRKQCGFELRFIVFIAPHFSRARLAPSLVILRRSSETTISSRRNYPDAS